MFDRSVTVRPDSRYRIRWAGLVLILAGWVMTGRTAEGDSPAPATPPAAATFTVLEAAAPKVIAPGLRLVGPNRAVEILGVKFVGVNAENGRKLLLTLAYVTILMLLARAGHAIVFRLNADRRGARVSFWSRQAVSLGTAVFMILGFASIWFDDPARLATILGLISAGLAFALQRVVTAVSGYFVILRGKTFNVGDRITMGGVRGDVIALGFIQTTIMEMGQPPSVEANAEPAMWVRSRQYTGRIVTVTNDKIFDEPVYNYTRDFPYIWEEIVLPVSYSAPRETVEQILLEAAHRHAVPAASMSEHALAEIERRYIMKTAEIAPRVFYRLTDNWLEMTVRFLVEDHGIRAVKDAMSRHILNGLEQAGIPMYTATLDIVGLPPLQVVGQPQMVDKSNRAPLTSQS